MKIFIPCWGDKHINLLDKALGACLRWPQNNRAIFGAEWIIVTDSASSFEKIKQVLFTIRPDIDAKAIIYSDLSYKGIDSGMILIKAIQSTAEVCISENESLLMATPDFIYADGTIDAFKAAGKEAGSCVTIAHIRATPDLLNSLVFTPSNKELMALAWRYPHISWSGSNSDGEQKRIYRGGVCWTQMSQTQKLVQHYMPSPFFVNFLPKDLTSFNTPHEGRPPGFGMWDHVWPSELLNDGRLRFIGSSNAAMMVEITDQDMNVPPIDDPKEHGFFRNHFHNKIQKQFLSVFEGL